MKNSYDFLANLVTKQTLTEQAMSELRTSVDLSGYATEAYVNNAVDGLATEDYVETAITNAFASIGIAEEGEF